MTKRQVVRQKEGLDVQQAFMQQLLEIQPRLKMYALSLTRSGDRADDLLQDTFVKAAAGYKTFEVGTNIAAWAFRIMRNEFVSEIRRRRPTVPIDTAIGNTLSVLPDQGKQVDYQSALLYLACLVKDQRDAIVAAAYVGMGYEAIGLLFNISVGTVKSRISRGRDALERLQEQATIESVDISEFKHATAGIPKSDPYYPIAKAYEEMFEAVNASDSLNGTVVTEEAQPVSEEEKRWRELVVALDQGDEELPSFMR